MSFSVELAALDKLADEAQGLADLTGYGSYCSATTAQMFTYSYVQLGYIPPVSVYSQVAGLTDEVRTNALSVFERMGTTFGASATEVRATAQNYEDLDQAERARLDAAYPDAAAVGAVSLPPPACVVSPAHAFETIPAPAATDWVSKILSANWLSPTDMVATIIDMLFDWNPLDEVSKRFVGDWSYVESTAAAFGQLGDYCRATGNSAINSASAAMADWTGEAAEAAAAWFAQWPGIGDDLGSQFDTLQNEYTTIAIGMAALGDILAGLFAQIMDQILYVALLALAGTALIETVIGTVILWALAVLEAAKVPSLIIEAYQTVQKANDYWNVLAAAVSVIQLQLTPASITAAIPGGYDNTQVDA